MPKNINSITITIILEDGCRIKNPTDKHKIVEEQSVNCNVVSSRCPQLFRSFYYKLNLLTKEKSKYSSERQEKD